MQIQMKKIKIILQLIDDIDKGELIYKDSYDFFIYNKYKIELGNYRDIASYKDEYFQAYTTGRKKENTMRIAGVDYVFCWVSYENRFFK